MVVSKPPNQIPTFPSQYFNKGSKNRVLKGQSVVVGIIKKFTLFYEIKYVI